MAKFKTIKDAPEPPTSKRDFAIEWGMNTHLTPIWDSFHEKHRLLLKQQEDLKRHFVVPTGTSNTPPPATVKIPHFTYSEYPVWDDDDKYGNGGTGNTT